MQQYQNGLVLIRSQKVRVEMHRRITGYFSRRAHEALFVEPLCIGIVHFDREADK